jgi:hypothetical protein
MHSKYFLLVTAIIEVGTGLLLLFVPSVPVRSLLGVDQIAVEANVCARCRWRTVGHRRGVLVWPIRPAWPLAVWAVGGRLNL